MKGFALLLGKEIREQARTMRLVVVVAVFAVFGLLSPVFARYVREIVDAAGAGQLGVAIPDPTVADAVIQFTKNMGQFGVLIAILLPMGAVATEKERGTAAFILTKPLTRTAFIAAKAAVIGGLLAVAIAIAGGLAWTYTTILFEPLPAAGYAAAVGLVWLSLAVFAALTLLLSVVARSALVAGGIGLGLVFATGIVSALPGIGAYMPTSLWGAADQLALGTVPDPFAGPVLVNVLLAVGAVALAAAIFRRQEL
ncbi:MAG TPA: ABC transporter permease subunit [Patescibacteria group bacterium]|nr:ABC transporter permease subunit [Patescibacteria group bacterium]